MPKNTEEKGESKDKDFSLVSMGFGDMMRYLKEARSLANSNNKESVKDLLTALYWSIKLLLGEEDSSELDLDKAKQIQEHMRGIAKVQIAYVYYYARYVELCVFGAKPDGHGRLKDPEAKLKREIFERDGLATSDFTKMFIFLLEGNSGSNTYCFVQDHATMAAHFFESMVDLKGKMFKNAETMDGSKALTLDDFFTGHEVIPNFEDSSDTREFADSMLAKAKEDPLGALLAQLIAESAKTKYIGAEMPKIDSDGKSILDKLYKLALEKEGEKSLAENLLAKYNEARKKDTETVQSALMSFGKDLRANRKDREQKKDGDHKQEGPVKFEDELAMNMADYITGRIDAKEFARRDRQIRDRQPLGGNPNMEQLDEVDEDPTD